MTGKGSKWSDPFHCLHFWFPRVYFWGGGKRRWHSGCLALQRGNFVDTVIFVFSCCWIYSSAVSWCHCLRIGWCWYCSGHVFLRNDFYIYCLGHGCFFHSFVSAPRSLDLSRRHICIKKLTFWCYYLQIFWCEFCPDQFLPMRLSSDFVMLILFRICFWCHYLQFFWGVQCVSSIFFQCHYLRIFRC